MPQMSRDARNIGRESAFVRPSSPLTAIFQYLKAISLRPTWSRHQWWIMSMCLARLYVIISLIIRTAMAEVLWLWTTTGPTIGLPRSLGTFQSQSAPLPPALAIWYAPLLVLPAGDGCRFDCQLTGPPYMEKNRPVVLRALGIMAKSESVKSSRGIGEVS